MKYIDSILNKLTMYRLALFELLFLLAAAAVLGTFGLVPYSPIFLAYSLVFLFVVAWVVNKIFAWCFNAPSNPESTYITVLILALLISPPSSFVDMQFFTLAGWAAAISVASKYIFAIKQKHIFNPAAFGVAATALFLGLSASWWVGTLWMLPFVAFGGFLLARKIRRTEMVIAFGVMLVFTILTLSIGDGPGVFHILQESLLYAPAVFLATVMLTEPLTTPPTRLYQIQYAAIVAFLFAPEVHFGSVYFSPELALLVGNVFSYAVSAKEKLILTLKDRIQLSHDTYEFVFTPNRKMNYVPGQYLEWTLAHKHADTRGIRRFFTIASSPTDPDIRLGVKIYEPSSSYKKALMSMRRGGKMVASQLAGDFTMPTNKKKKLVFIAGGIGITPFKSMIQYLVDTKEKRDIIMLYSNRTIQDVAYVNLLDQAEKEIGIETYPVFSSQTPEQLANNEFPTKIDQHMIMTSVPDYMSRTYYLSGPPAMVNAFNDMLKELGIPNGRIKKDFFPGFA